MLQTWNKFCFTTGYIEVSATFPGPDQNTQGYVSCLSFFRLLAFFFLCVAEMRKLLFLVGSVAVRVGVAACSVEET
jgi:hypothetical protein